MIQGVSIAGGATWPLSASTYSVPSTPGDRPVATLGTSGTPQGRPVATLGTSGGLEGRPATAWGTSSGGVHGRPWATLGTSVRQLPGRPHLPTHPASRTLSTENAAERTQQLQAALTTRTTDVGVTLTTADGDRVTLSGQQTIEASRVTYTDGSGTTLSASTRSIETMLSVSVQGEIDPKERAGIRLLLRDLLGAFA